MLEHRADQLKPLPSVIRKFLVLDPRRVEFRIRGFDLAEKSHEERLESIGKTFLRGYNLILSARSLAAFEQAMAEEPALLRGFFVEGGAMGSALVDSIPFRRPMLGKFRERFEERFPLLVNAGTGLAMSKLSWREKAIVGALDPFYRWMAYDGMGYHNVYFQQEKTLNSPKRILEGYASRAYDQGVGRGIWFVSGADIDKAAALAGSMTADRQADIWSGIGLASCYAGPADEKVFIDGYRLAGPSGEWFAQGIGFACSARMSDQSMPETICAAIRTLWDMEPEALAALVEQLRQDNVTRTRSDRPRYEAWRHSVAAAFTQNIAGRRLSDAKGIPFPPEGEREAVPSETRSQST
ncbi:DUF1702 family protein [uncultured Parasphingorhabdus sp.]|uniref:DUF1702 family protein n=1 Tax=uncultured Parasphingorhabdus sp. TaxID=2709694 RepID=UPI0030DBDD21|tara:strand:- start:24309 stop:25367 length:1059 start_codon:yes stop_codon:yes gene_type:complete